MDECDQGQNLTGEGQKELQSFLNFFNLKKADSLKEIELEFSEFKSHQVQDTLYNKEDMNELLNLLLKNIQVLANQEISKIIHMGGVYVKIFLSAASELNFHADFNFIENIKIIEQMQILEKGGSIVEEGQTTKKTIKYSRLPTIDVGQQKQFDEVQKENDFLKQYNQKLQNELVNLKKGQVQESESVQSLQEQIVLLKEENIKLMAELDKKVNESVQFKSLKQMIQEKNQTIKDLQLKLSLQT